jgi:hypothetical protein
MEGSDCCLIQGSILAFAWRDWGRPRKACQDSWSLDWDLNPGPPEQEQECQRLDRVSPLVHLRGGVLVGMSMETWLHGCNWTALDSRFTNVQLADVRFNIF